MVPIGHRTTIGNDAFSASFLVDTGTLGVSLRHRGVELIAMPRSVEQYALGWSTGIPLLHPWANRLASNTYHFEHQTITIVQHSVPSDRNGLAIHGTMQGRRFILTTHSESEMTAFFDFNDPELLASFPFPHRITITVTIVGTTLEIMTEVRNDGTTAMPISFGWHPFLTLPSRPRSTWRLRTPACVRHVLDAHMVPTGATDPQPLLDAPIGIRTYDDHFALGDDRVFIVADDDRTITLTFDNKYPFAQIYLPAPDAPLAGDFVCIEPMTAPSNALVSQRASKLDAGETYAAAFRIDVN